jgi:hypothetical protein
MICAFLVHQPFFEVVLNGPSKDAFALVMKFFSLHLIELWFLHLMELRVLRLGFKFDFLA